MSQAKTKIDPCGSSTGVFIYQMLDLVHCTNVDTDVITITSLTLGVTEDAVLGLGEDGIQLVGDLAYLGMGHIWVVRVDGAADFKLYGVGIDVDTDLKFHLIIVMKVHQARFAPSDLAHSVLKCVTCLLRSCTTTAATDA